MSSTLLTQKINNKRIQIKGGQLIIEMTRLVQKGNNTVKSLLTCAHCIKLSSHKG